MSRRLKTFQSAVSMIYFFFNLITFLVASRQRFSTDSSLLDHRIVLFFSSNLFSTNSFKHCIPNFSARRQSICTSDDAFIPDDREMIAVDSVKTGD